MDEERAAGWFPAAGTAALDAIVRTPERAGILLDFDGTLGPIVERPGLAVLAKGARAALTRLAARYRVVATISGRTQEELARLVDADGVRLVGLYGLGTESVSADVISAVGAAAAEVEGAWVEPKGPTVAVHFRAAPDAEAAARTLKRYLAPLAGRSSMELAFGKRVVELVPAGRPLKEGAVERIVDEERLSMALYAGDDVADLRAFAALDRACASGRLQLAVKVAVRGADTPAELVAAADIVLEGPEEMVEVLDRL